MNRVAADPTVGCLEAAARIELCVRMVTVTDGNRAIRWMDVDRTDASLRSEQPQRKIDPTDGTPHPSVRSVRSACFRVIRGHAVHHGQTVNCVAADPTVACLEAAARIELCERMVTVTDRHRAIGWMDVERTAASLRPEQPQRKVDLTDGTPSPSVRSVRSAGFRVIRGHAVRSSFERTNPTPCPARAPRTPATRASPRTRPTAPV